MPIDALSIFAFIGLFLTMTAIYVVGKFIVMNFVDLAQEHKDAEKLELMAKLKQWYEPGTRVGERK